jgi:GNAT superfamily N-acetyltransferase
VATLQAGAPADEELSLRPALPEDRAFLVDVFVSARRGALAPLGWDDAAARAFLETQFEHEERDWRSHVPGAECQVVLRGGQPVGRLCLARSAQEIRVMDLTLLPEQRHQGIATRLLAELMEEARSTRRTVRLHVDRSNGLAELCRRLGFMPAATRAGTWLMEWTAEVSH